MSKTLAEKLNSPGPKRILSLDGGGIRGVNLDIQRFKSKKLNPMGSTKMIEKIN